MPAGSPVTVVPVMGVHVAEALARYSIVASTPVIAPLAPPPLVSVLPTDAGAAKRAGIERYCGGTVGGVVCRDAVLYDVDGQRITRRSFCAQALNFYCSFFLSCGIFFQKNIQKKLSIQIMVVSLSPLAPAKPLYNAQIGGAFYFLVIMKVNYSKTCTLPQDLIPLLKSRGLLIPNEQKAISYLTNIGYFK